MREKGAKLIMGCGGVLRKRMHKAVCGTTFAYLRSGLAWLRGPPSFPQRRRHGSFFLSQRAAQKEAPKVEGPKTQAGLMVLVAPHDQHTKSVHPICGPLCQLIGEPNVPSSLVGPEQS